MKNSLLNANPHLNDPVQRKLAMIRNIVTSSAIEGIHVEFDEATGQFSATKTRQVQNR